MMRLKFTPHSIWYFISTVVILAMFTLVIMTPKLSKSAEIPEQDSLPESILCKHVSDSPLIKIEDAEAPALFLNIKSVYLAGGLRTANPELKKNTLFAKGNLTSLARCVIQRHLQTFWYSSEFKDAPLAINVLDTSPEKSVETRENGNLTIVLYLTGQVEKKSFFGSSQYLTLQVLFYRPEIPAIEYISRQCAASFSYVEDRDVLLPNLTVALERCLRDRYVRSKGPE